MSLPTPEQRESFAASFRVLRDAGVELNDDVLRGYLLCALLITMEWLEAPPVILLHVGEVADQAMPTMREIRDSVYHEGALTE